MAQSDYSVNIGFGTPVYLCWLLVSYLYLFINFSIGLTPYENKQNKEKGLVTF